LLCDSFHISRVRIIADVKAKYRIDTPVPLCRPSALDFYYMHTQAYEKTWIRQINFSTARGKW
jgi:hypothetical protein